MALPAHVAAIEPEHVCLGGGSPALIAALKASAYADQLFRDARLRSCIRFAERANPLANAELAQLLRWLAEHEVAFLEVVGQAYGPAELMRALQADGSVPAGFKSLLVRGPDDWSLHDHPLA